LVAVLSINTAMSANAFEIEQMNRDLENLEAQANKLDELLVGQDVPARLAAKAAELGMVPAPHTSYILLGEGTVIEPVVTDSPPEDGDGLVDSGNGLPDDDLTAEPNPQGADQ